MRYLFFLLAFSRAFAGEYLPNEWIFSLPENASLNWSEVRSQLGGAYTFIRTFGPSERHALFVLDDTYGPSPLPRNLKAQRNFSYKALEVDPYFEKQWALENLGQSAGESGTGTVGADIGAKKAWTVFTGNKNFMLAVLDTGMDLQHEDLQKNRWRNNKEIAGNGIDDDKNGFIDDFEGWNFSEQNSNVQDKNHHGTFVAGIIAADSQNGKGIRGVVKDASLMTVKMLDENGNGTSEQAISAIEYAVKKGAKVINASWGGRSFDPALFESVKWAGEQGVVFVAAAGNSANDNDGANPVYPASFKLPNVISVTSVDNKNAQSVNTSYGKQSTHLAAPGVQIYSLMPANQYAFLNGTSFAAPFVSAAALLVWTFDPTLSIEKLKKRLMETTVPLPYYDRDKTASQGKLNLYNALKDIRPVRHVEPKIWKRVTWSRSTPHPYQNDDVFSWTIHHPGATHLRLHLQKFQTELDYDRLTLKDKEGKVVREYSGDLDDTLTMDALGDSVSLHFLADYVKAGYGFDIDYYEYSTEQ